MGLREDILSNPTARDAYDEACVRRVIAERIAAEMEAPGFSYRKLAGLMDASLSTVQKLLNRHRGSTLTLMTLVRASRALGITIFELIEE